MFDWYQNGNPLKSENMTNIISNPTDMQTDQPRYCISFFILYRIELLYWNNAKTEVCNWASRRFRFQRDAVILSKVDSKLVGE